MSLRDNWRQFSLLVVINAFVGAMVGLERAVLPELASVEFGLASTGAVLSFIVVFGITKAAANYVAGTWSDRHGRRKVLVAGWLLALPVPVLLLWAPSWGWILAANALLGVSQGLTWSMTVVMKVDLAGEEDRGLAMGLNEFAGYLAVAGSALLTGWLASEYGLSRWVLAGGLVYAAVGTALSVVWARETRGPARSAAPVDGVFARVTLRDPDLSSVTQAGFVNNLNDGMAWGLFPLLFVAAGMSMAQLGWLAAIVPAVWGVGQLVTGWASDHVGRKPFIVGGMLVQAGGIALIGLSAEFVGFAIGGALLGAGTAMVYPTLLAAIGDVAAPSWRGSAIGVYRLWRDLGYAAGALLAGGLAAWIGLQGAVFAVAGLTLLSGLVAAARMRPQPSAKGPVSRRVSANA